MTAECSRVAQDRGVVVGSSWGSLTPAQAKWWATTNCDGLLRAAAPAAALANEEPRPVVRARELAESPPTAAAESPTTKVSPVKPAQQVKVRWPRVLPDAQEIQLQMMAHSV